MSPTKASKKPLTHSPLPLKIESSGLWMQPIQTADGRILHVEVINGRRGESNKFAQLIVRAVNSHDVAREMARIILLRVEQGDLLGQSAEASLARKFQELDRE